MKRTMIGKIALCAGALLALAGRGWALIAFQPGGSLRVEGDSTLHRWSSTATVIAMSFELDGGAPQSLFEAIQASRVKSMEARIAVAGLKSGESGLDKNMRKAMKEAEFPDVVYRLGRYALKKDAPGGVLAAKAEGELTIAGRTKPVSIDVEFRAGPDAVAVTGSAALLMSDYGIKPPTLMLGAIKVRDPVAIRFDLILKPQKENTP